MLSFASVIGHEFDLRVLAEATQKDPFEVLEGIEGAMEASLVVDTGAECFSLAPRAASPLPLRRAEPHPKVLHA